MGIIIWIVSGVLVGWGVSATARSDRRQGAAVFDILAGTAGAVAGGFIASSLRGSAASEFELYSFLSALLGAVIIVVLVRMFRVP